MTPRRVDGLIRIRLQFFAQERTEPATPRRRAEARRKGQVARSGEVSTAFVLLASFLLLYLLAGWVARDVTEYARRVFEEMHTRFTIVEAAGIPALFLEMILVAGKSAAPFLGAAVVVGFLSQLLQVGFLASAEPLIPRFERVNPLSGLKRIFSKRALVELLKAVVKVLIVGGVAYLSLRGSFPVFVEFMEWPPLEAVHFVGLLVFRTGLWVGLAMFLLAYADYRYQKWEFEKSIRMTKQEVREEYRQTEGDPQIRAKIRQRQRQIASMRMMAKVPTADVVITNPVHLAVALAYDPGEMEAPVVVAKGAGPLAERIKQTAREHGVTVVENVSLARALYESAEINAKIPEELYQAVAEVLAFVYRLRRAGGAGKAQ